MGTVNATARRWMVAGTLGLERPNPPPAPHNILCLRYLSREEGYAWPAVATLASDLNISRRTVQKAINVLIERGHLIVDRRCGRGNPNKYRLTDNRPKEESPAQGFLFEETALPKTIKGVPWDAVSNTKGVPRDHKRRPATTQKASHGTPDSFEDSYEEPYKAPPRGVPQNILQKYGLSEKTANDIIAHRKAKRAPLTPRAAELLGKAFADYGDPERAAAEMLVRGWQSFKPSWMPANGKPHPIAAATPGIFIKRDTPQWEAWNAWWWENKGKSMPGADGWHCPSEWPPGGERP